MQRLFTTLTDVQLLLLLLRLFLANCTPHIAKWLILIKRLVHLHTRHHRIIFGPCKRWIWNVWSSKVKTGLQLKVNCPFNCLAQGKCNPCCSTCWPLRCVYWHLSPRPLLLKTERREQFALKSSGDVEQQGWSGGANLPDRHLDPN